MLLIVVSLWHWVKRGGGNSRAVLRKTKSGDIWSEWVPGIDSSHLQVRVWVYCPDHTGVRGYKRAYRLASAAIAVRTATVDKGGVLMAVFRYLIEVVTIAMDK